MEVTDVRIFLRSGDDRKLKAYATITFDHAFVVRNIKVIQGTQGPFIAMPSRKLRHPCARCSHRNEARSRYCNQCGAPQPESPPAVASTGEREPEHLDVAHPITSECRSYLQTAILKAYEEELARGGVVPPPPHSPHEAVGG